MNSNPLDRRSNGLFWIVKAKLENLFGKNMILKEILSLSRKLSKKYDILLDRNASRNKDLLISWICENWNTFENDVEHFHTPKINFITKKSRNEERIMSSWNQMFNVQKVLEDIYGIQKMKMPQLLKIASAVCDIKQLRLDRNAKRNKKVLLAWFSENWDQIEPILKVVKQKNSQILSDASNNLNNHNVDDSKTLEMNKKTEEISKPNLTFPDEELKLDEFISEDDYFFITNSDAETLEMESMYSLF
ncbi:hypothetical protein TRFO_26334 [Tritrichomonas foetus]|uniref:Uncharacterized protein n=1 Tax=Tritrichomonas foetus TaxID=1144522 RepID=A0A1J4K7Z8_9EUKA|nr:hypothetical protein TRFO_26334 [Tritrichomonas foetus]|eukprot:OHT05828.1 hypothetical protein TRFO_26334 [Tritrichomonas foetus]